ncbi:alpha-L-arabinofuranosidase [Halanaerobium saccharolyticum]|uniref:non-reducing end alpha-L-arabinofuranosidase n=1 Tax=Halanaerobium saccharolyticum TaxID=43595 RepID=A0A4R6LZA1_9FIRM|nr:alpha-L-arabinofuranosidase C-terminal domain-containing protein [Halanaerobium saccharolyticum]TDO94124.1 alpha-L-arabinofuranosidase [Halanaerobium saccharolyticum]
MIKIKLDIDNQIGKVDKNIFGSFLEHIRDAVYGGVYNTDSNKTDADNFRTDVIEAVNDLSISNVRWPGGNFVSGYHWYDGIGPKENRPQKKELAWNDIESNQFGTDEFMKWCEKADVEPHICVNMGNGTMEEAQNWVEYCNSNDDSYYAALRNKYGRNEPYNVKYWGLGNEIWGEWQIGHKSAEDYTKEAVEYAKVMKRVDPSIELIACGAGFDWNITVLDKLIKDVDYLSIHMYVGNEKYAIGDHQGVIKNEVNDYYNYMSTGELIEKNIQAAKSQIKAVGNKYRLSQDELPKLCIDEWAALHWWGDEEGYQNYEDALVTAMFFNSFINNADFVKMANNLSLFINVQTIFTKENDILLQTVYYPMQLYANYRGNKAVQLNIVDVDNYKHDGREIPYLNCSATVDEEEKKIYLNVVNLNLEKSYSVQIINQNLEINKEVIVREILADDVKAENTFDNKNRVTLEQRVMTISSNNFEFNFAPHSITSLEIKY